MSARRRSRVTGTFINVGAVLLGTAIGVGAGRRLPAGLQRRVLAGLGLVTAVIGVDLALAWRDTSPLYVLGASLFDGVLCGEALSAMTSTGGVLIIAIALKLLDLTDVKVGNFLPALVLAPELVGVVSLL
jgi:uncharacterized membrane protein YqgA involved in biofilm formation